MSTTQEYFNRLLQQMRQPDKGAVRAAEEALLPLRKDPVAMLRLSITALADKTLENYDRYIAACVGDA